MPVSRPALLALALAAAPAAHAFVMIDDFTVGDYRAVLEGVGSDAHFVGGLDRQHVAFGDRITDLSISSNPDRIPVTLDVGGGNAGVSGLDGGRSRALGTEFRVEWGNSRQVVLDLSREAEIWVDIEVKDPDGRFADVWSLRYIDADGRSGTNGSWTSRNGGIAFDLATFTGSVDRSRIVNLQFTQLWTPPAHPESYTMTRVYAVPEPSTLALGGLALGACLRRRPKTAA